MLLNFCLLVGGCILLYLGATWLVRGASEIALVLKIPKAIVGLSFVALGTSAPELIVNFHAAYRGETGFALTNISGSNLTNLLVGFGLCGVISGLLIHWRTFRYDLSALVLSAALPVLIMLLYGGSPQLPLWSVLPLGAGLIAYLWTLKRRSKDLEAAEADTKPHRHPSISFAVFFLGAFTLYGGGRLVLDAAIRIAAEFEIATSLVGLTIVAAGTSIPDAIASSVAAGRVEHDLAVGNLLGSNIANVLMVITGTLLASWVGNNTTMIDGKNPLIVLDYIFVAVISLTFFAIAVRWGRITRRGGTLMIATYLCYMGPRIYFEFQ